MIARLEVERARHTPAPHLYVLRLRTADRDARMRQVGHGEEPVAQTGLDARELSFQGVQLVADRADLGHRRGRIFAPALRGADLSGQRVAPGLQLLRSSLDRFPIRLDTLEFLGVEHVAAVAQSQSDAG